MGRDKEGFEVGGVRHGDVGVEVHVGEGNELGLFPVLMTSVNT